MTVKDLSPTSLKMPHDTRTTISGDTCTGLLHKTYFNIKTKITEQFCCFEHSGLLLKVSSSTWNTILVIYQLDPNITNRFPVDMFLNKFLSMLDRLLSPPIVLVILETNFHL